VIALLVAGTVAALASGDGGSSKPTSGTAGLTVTSAAGGNAPSTAAPPSTGPAPGSTGPGQGQAQGQGGNVSNSSSVSISIKSAVRNGSGVIQVRGVATAGATATLNGAPIGIGPDGTWSADLPVHPGPTTVTATAVSADGSSRSSSTVTVNG
jgi:hypothetical protein